MPAKDKRYRHVKRQLKGHQKIADDYAIQMLASMSVTMVNFFREDKICRYGFHKGSYHWKDFIQKYSIQYDPHYFIKQEKHNRKKKHRQPTRRIAWR